MKRSKANTTIEYKFQEAFIKLSKQGWSLDRIAQKLNVSKKTLDEWNKELYISPAFPQTPRITSRHLNNKLNTTRKYNRTLVVNPEPGKRRLQMEYHDYIKQIEKPPTKKKGNKKKSKNIGKITFDGKGSWGSIYRAKLFKGSNPYMPYSGGAWESNRRKH